LTITAFAAKLPVKYRKYQSSTYSPVISWLNPPPYQPVMSWSNPPPPYRIYILDVMFWIKMRTRLPIFQFSVWLFVWREGA